MKFYRLAEARGKLSVNYFHSCGCFVIQISTAVFLPARSVWCIVDTGRENASRILINMAVTVHGFILN